LRLLPLRQRLVAHLFSFDTLLFLPLSSHLLHDHSPFQFGEPCIKIGWEDMCIPECAAILVDCAESISDFLRKCSVVVGFDSRKNRGNIAVEGMNHKLDCGFSPFCLDIIASCRLTLFNHAP